MKKAISTLFIGTVLSCSIFAQSVKIGDQTWKSKNLNVSKFRNGDPIPQAQTKDEWLDAAQDEKPAWCYLNNDPGTARKYGRIYNWYAVNDSRGIAPKGWHVPSKKEWGELTFQLGGVDAYSKRLRSKKGWENYGCRVCYKLSFDFQQNCSHCNGGKSKSEYPHNSNGNNSSGFNAYPSGSRTLFGFEDFGSSCDWWSSTEDDEFFANYFSLNNYDDFVDRVLKEQNYSATKEHGAFIRCIKD